MRSASQTCYSPFCIFQDSKHFVLPFAAMHAGKLVYCLCLHLTDCIGLQLAESQKNDLEARDRLLRLQVGVDVAGEGEFVMYVPRPGPRGSIDVGVAEVQVGRRHSAAEPEISDSKFMP